jgi:hypothetical protein
VSELLPEPLPERGAGGRFLPRATAPERTPERQKLAAAIEYLSALDTQLKRLAEARSRLDLRGRESAHAAARQALDEARKRAPEALVAKMMGEAYDPAQTVDDHAQGLLEDAQRELDEATAADELLADEIKDVEGRRSVAQIGRDRALTEVLRTAPEIAELRERIDRARQQLHDSTWICAAIGMHRLPRIFWDGVLWGRDRGLGGPWKAAIAALEVDADAALPNCEVNAAEAKIGASSDSAAAPAA